MKQVYLTILTIKVHLKVITIDHESSKQMLIFNNALN